MKRFLLTLVLTACSAETSMDPSDGGLEEDALQAGQGGGGGGGGAGERSDSSLVGFSDGGEDASAPEPEPDAASADAGSDGSTTETDAGPLSPELFAGTWDIEETNCTFPSGPPIKDTWTFMRFTGQNAPDVFIIWNGGVSLRLEGSELVNTEETRRFWLIDQDTLGGTTAAAASSCPEYMLVGKRQL